MMTLRELRHGDVVSNEGAMWRVGRVLHTGVMLYILPNQSQPLGTSKLLLFRAADGEVNPVVFTLALRRGVNVAKTS